MQGFNTLWVPGTDHAAISTEVKIVEKLKEEGINKTDLGREKFLEKAWEWTNEYGGTIVKQQKRLGCSADWSRARFTMDEGLSEAVLTVFKKLYDKGLIYKGKRMINWCPCCNTSISDIEVEYEEETIKIDNVTLPAGNYKEIQLEYINITYIRVKQLKKDKIIKIPLEEYIVGVVSAEMPVLFEIEALKSQAVAARTYALKRMIEDSKDYDSIRIACRLLDELDYIREQSLKLHEQEKS